MMIFIIIVLIGLVILSGVAIYKIWILKRAKSPVVSVASVDDVFNLHAFEKGEVFEINRHLTIAANIRQTKLAIIKNFNPKHPVNYSFFVLPITYILKIKDSKLYLELNYSLNNEIQSLKIKPVKKEFKEFLHNIYKKANFSILESKNTSTKFNLTASSDWAVGYVWAYSSKDNVFVYYDTEKNFVSHPIRLLKTNLTLDTKYSYFEMSIYNINQQLLVYENDFFDELFNSLLSKIKAKFAQIAPDSFYYDNKFNTAYLTNGLNSLQIVNLDTVEEVFYSENKLSFQIKENDKMINYVASKELVNRFEDFVINLNIRKIALSFNYSSDKLINTSDNTKLIIDYTRTRIVYCANLNTFSKFNYCLIAFDKIKDVEYIKHGQNVFIRLFLNRNDKIDITCKKKEVAQYILAQIRIIITDSLENQE